MHILSGVVAGLAHLAWLGVGSAHGWGVGIHHEGHEGLIQVRKETEGGAADEFSTGEGKATKKPSGRASGEKTANGEREEPRGRGVDG